MSFNQELVQKIIKLKKEKNAVILAHCYQNIEIDEVADYVGDSLYLSQMAAKTDADIIVFAGVYFMAETAKILSPNKKVLLPSLKAGCLMADMINLEQIREFKSKHPNVPVVCYVNSTAEVKSQANVCCTSSNAVNVVKSLNVKEVLFVPDTYLGNFVKSQLNGEVNIIAYPGYCPTHLRITPKDVLDMKAKYPNAKVLAHPECHSEVVKLADFVGSTTAIMNEAKKSNDKTFIIATELGVVERLKRDVPDKEFILVSKKAVCPNMKCHHLEDIYNALLYEQHEINVSEKLITAALKPIQKMVAINA
ncbi:MAG: quinolinate synthase NadA [Candidatus Gastranaerophilales bacterium]|nr:quinolinate synthase NadA [Candidatus Gastranaerophilales bacterium]